MTAFYFFDELLDNAGKSRYHESMVTKYANTIIISLLCCIVILLGVLTYSASVTEPPQDAILQPTTANPEYDYRWYCISPEYLIAHNRTNYKEQITPDIIHFPDGWEYVAPLHSGPEGDEYVLLRRPKNARLPFKHKLKQERYDSSSKKLRNWKNAAPLIDMTIGASK